MQLNSHELRFLLELKRLGGVASPYALRPHVSKKANFVDGYVASRSLNRLGLIEFDDGYWRLTDAGKET
jgi:hypothetical protein